MEWDLANQKTKAFLFQDKRKETRFHSGILFLFRTDCYFPIFSTFAQHIFSSVFATPSKSASRPNFNPSSDNDQALQIEKSFRSLCRTTISLTPNHTFGKKSCHFLKHLNKHKNSFHFYLYREEDYNTRRTNI